MHIENTPNLNWIWRSQKRINTNPVCFGVECNQYFEHDFERMDWLLIWTLRMRLSTHTHLPCEKENQFSKQKLEMNFSFVPDSNNNLQIILSDFSIFIFPLSLCRHSLEPTFQRLLFWTLSKPEHTNQMISWLRSAKKQSCSFYLANQKLFKEELLIISFFVSFLHTNAHTIVSQCQCGSEVPYLSDHNEWGSAWQQTAAYLAIVSDQEMVKRNGFAWSASFHSWVILLKIE